MLSWKTIPEFSKYEVSSDGLIRRSVFDFRNDKRGHKPGRLLRLQQQANGYLSVSLMSDAGKLKTIFVHQAVAITFRGPRPSRGHCARYLDDNKKNNKLDNIHWGTYVENEADKKRNGNTACGVRNGLAKLTKKQVLRIRSLYCQGVDMYTLGDKFGISPSAAWRCATRRTYVNV
jgi:hypothetical protein